MDNIELIGENFEEICKSFKNIKEAFNKYGIDLLEYYEECELTGDEIGIVDIVINSIEDKKEIIKIFKFCYDKGYNFRNTFYNLLNSIRKTSADQKEFNKTLKEQKIIFENLIFFDAEFEIDTWNEMMEKKRTKYIIPTSFISKYTI